MSVFSLFGVLKSPIINCFLHKNISLGEGGWNLFSIKIPTLLLKSEEIMSSLPSSLYSEMVSKNFSSSEAVACFWTQAYALSY